jgi:hypothetical protein
MRLNFNWPDGLINADSKLASFRSGVPSMPFLSRFPGRFFIRV